VAHLTRAALIGSTSALRQVQRKPWFLRYGLVSIWSQAKDASVSATEYFARMAIFVTLNSRYVNMADIKIRDDLGLSSEQRAVPAVEPRWDVIELLFFAYRDFVGDADDVLEAFGFGRAHHRVVHFVQRYPGLTVADLLDVLRITKQSLGRVLKQLLDEGYIIQKAGDVDRRQRLLFATTKGEALVAKLAGLQTDRIDRALQGLSPENADAVRRFLRGMIDRDSSDKVLEEIMSNGSSTVKLNRLGRT
jgi:DNA-binding MarR family transcriptional regulator